MTAAQEQTRELLDRAGGLFIATLLAAHENDDRRYRVARQGFRAIARRVGTRFPNLWMNHLVARLAAALPNVTPVEIRRNARRDAVRHWPELAWIDLNAIKPWGSA
jgi:hypothetical protein